jgi:hypothetical protein
MKIDPKDDTRTEDVTFTVAELKALYNYLGERPAAEIDADPRLADAVNIIYEIHLLP